MCILLDVNYQPKSDCLIDKNLLTVEFPFLFYAYQ